MPFVMLVCDIYALPARSRGAVATSLIQLGAVIPTRTCMYVYVRVPRGLIVHGRTGGINNNNNNMVAP